MLKDVSYSRQRVYDSVEYQVFHQNERRIRLLMPRLAFDKVYAGRLEFLIKSLNWVTNIRINPAAKSIAVEFDYKADVAEIVTARQQVFEAIEQALYIEIDDSIAPASVEEDVNYWQGLGLPVTTLGLALLASPLEVSIPLLVMGGLIAGAAVSVFQRAIAGIVDEGKCKVDVLDLVWIFLQTLQGQYVAPALMLSILETGEAIRDITARANKQETAQLLDSIHNQVQLQKTPVTNTQVGDYVQDVSDRLVIPTLFLSGSIFALTGEVTPALAPLQLDFGTGIGIAVPTTILAALTSVADSGVLIRNGCALEALSRIDTIVFGNTHTLNRATGVSLTAPPSTMTTQVSTEGAIAIASLKEKGIEVYLVSESVFPEQKIEIIRQLQKQGKTVAYVGDDLRDTLPLACVSVAFAKETDIERETADVLIVGNDLSRLIHAINIAKQAIDIVYQNIAIVAVPNISVVIAGIFFGLHPVAAVLINSCAALIAQSNGERPLFNKNRLSRNNGNYLQ